MIKSRRPLQRLGMIHAFKKGDYPLTPTRAFDGRPGRRII